MSVKKHIISCGLGLVLLIFFSLSPAYAYTVDPEHVLKDEVMKEQIKKATDILDVQYTSVVKVQLKNYLVRFPKYTQELLGRKTIYFPFIEKELEKYGLPEDLKYLAVVESNLKPEAKSGVGATGLWQFMYGTAKEYGLEINHEVDERLNPIKSTEAAVQHLKNLFDRYEDWALAIAAYNSGVGNVNKAIRQANSTDFWNIRAYLPKETSQYVPAFIAAAYTFKHYMNYDLLPALPELDFQVTGGIRIYDHVTFNELAEWTNLSLDIINALNPGFHQSYIPKSSDGYVVVLPRRVIKYVNDHLSSVENQGIVNSTLQGTYEKIVFEGLEGDAISDIANYFNVNVYNIYTWNGTHLGDTLLEDTFINLFVYLDQGINVNPPHFRGPRETFNTPIISNKLVLEKPFSQDIENYDMIRLTSVSNASDLVGRTRIMIHKGQTIHELVEQYPELNIDKILALNNLNHVNQIRPGSYLFID